MKRPHPDPRYYNCAPPDLAGRETCNGKMVIFGFEPFRDKPAVYECTVCKRKAGEASLLTAYKQLKMRD